MSRNWNRCGLRLESPVFTTVLHPGADSGWDAASWVLPFPPQTWHPVADHGNLSIFRGSITSSPSSFTSLVSRACLSPLSRVSPVQALPCRTADPSAHVQAYCQSMLKAFKKTLEEGRFHFVVGRCSCTAGPRNWFSLALSVAADLG